LAVAAYLARFTGLFRTHTDSDLGAYLAWCAECGLDPLAAGRAQVELYIRWMREIRRLKPSTVGRRTSVVVGFYCTCVIDGVLADSPVDYVRRPPVPPESPVQLTSRRVIRQTGRGVVDWVVPESAPRSKAGASGQPTSGHPRASVGHRPSLAETNIWTGLLHSG